MSKFTSTSSSCLEPVAVVPYTFTRYNSGTALAAQVQKYSVNHRRGRRYYKGEFQTRCRNQRQAVHIIIIIVVMAMSLSSVTPSLLGDLKF